MLGSLISYLVRLCTCQGSTFSSAGGWGHYSVCLADLLHVGLLPTAGQHNLSGDFGLLLTEILLVKLVLVVGQLVLVIDINVQVLK